MPGRLFLILLALILPRALLAQNAAKDPSPLDERRQEMQRRAEDLQAVEGSIRQSDGDKLRTIKEVESLRGDRAKLVKDLIETTQRVRLTDEKLTLAETRISALQTSETALSTSLDARKDVMIEVLAALQRMGRKPPPAVLVSPHDILEAVRASIMLGAVLPELREEAEQLATDLSDLVQNREAQLKQRGILQQERENIAADRARLADLIAARQSQIDASEQQLRDERQRITALARKAQSLKELIASMETDIAGAARAVDAARKIPLPGGPNAQSTAMLRGDLKDTARLAPKIAFADLKGNLTLPTAGTVVKPYGAPDGFGGTEKGITIIPPAGAIISAPNDAWVAFAGSYRSYGQVLILNAGNGYHLLLIGVDHALVDVGQFVLAGEPIAVMGQGGTQNNSPKSDLPVKGQSLYIELRKDGQPIDSSPWWTQTTNEKARG